MSLSELIARLEKADGPDRELDALIWVATTEGARTSICDKIKTTLATITKGQKPHHD
jgi:hypothetical protein